MKYFRMSYEEVVFRRSYINLMLLNRAIPGFKPLNSDETGDDVDGDVDDVVNNIHNNKVKRKKAGNMHANAFFQQLM